MKQIYNFERKMPPVINENMLRAKIEQCRIRRITALLAVGSLLNLFCILLLAIPLYDISLVLFIACIVYVCSAVTGSSVIAIVFTQKRRSFQKC